VGATLWQPLECSERQQARCTRMRIHYYSASCVPSRSANSIHVVKMAAAFASRGCDVTLFHRPGTIDLPGSKYEFYGVPETFRFQEVPWPNVRGIGSFLYARALARQMADTSERPDLIYGRHVLSLLTSSAQDCPIRVEVHAPPENLAQHIMFSRLLRDHRLDRVIAISSALKEEYLRRFPGRDRLRITVAHDGADPVRGVIDESSTAISGPPRVGYVGHLYPGKGMNVIAELSRVLPMVEFHVVGGCEEDIEYWRRKCSRPNLILHGFVPHARIDEHLARFPIVLAPYQKSVQVSGGKGDVARWMSPLKLFEYMSRARCIVASRLPVIGEILEDGTDAILCDPENVDEWKQAIERLIVQPALLKKLAEAAHRKFTEQFTWDQRANRVLS